MSTNQLRRYLDLLNEADLVPTNTTAALPSSGTFSNDDALAAALAQQKSEPRCAVCGTPQSQHQNLQHQFQPGGAANRPAPVPQGPAIGDANLSRISRIKQLQRELLAAGANLGKTGANRDGIDGDIGPLTRAAMRKYPDIAVKYADLPAGQDATPGNIAQLNSALTAIEGILSKYKIKLNEDLESSTPEFQMKQWRSLLEAGPTAQQRQAYQDAIQRNLPPDPVTPTAQPTAASQTAAQRTMPRLSGIDLTPAQQAAQRAGMGMPSLVGAGPYATQAAQTAGTGTATAATTTAQAAQTAGTGTATAATTTTAKGVAGAAARRALPGVGLALGAYDAYNRATQGDYIGAGISGLSGIASLFPGLGTAASLGLLGLNTYLDLNKTPTVAITAEDAKIIADNIKIMQDWQQNPANQAALTPELKTRIANVLKGVSTLGVPTQAATPTTAPATPPTAPAAPAVNPKIDQINQTLDSMDRLLKKNKLESANNKKSPPLTESERMARLRNIVSEDVTDYALPVAGAAATGYGAYHGARALEKGASKPVAMYVGLKAVLKLAAKAVASMGKIGLLVGTGILLKALYDFAMADPQAVADAGINAQDIEEFNRLNEQLKLMIGDNNNFDTLPPETQQKIKAMHQRIVNMTAKIINQEAGGQK